MTRLFYVAMTIAMSGVMHKMYCLHETMNRMHSDDGSEFVAPGSHPGERKNVTRAARKANITQSAFSHALNRLREQLNDEMFVRTRNGMEPTPYAASMIPVIENALSKLEAATRGKATSTRLKIRIPFTLARWITSNLCICPR
jgi:hypothetical protein